MTTPTFADDTTEQRWYTHPVTEERWLSVTSILAYISKYGLIDWSAGMAADAALDHHELLAKTADRDPCNCTGDDACGECRDCVRTWIASRHTDYKNERGDLGTRFHKAAEHYILFGPGGHVDDDVKPYMNAWLKWVNKYGVEFEASEMTVFSRIWDYAGTTDGILRFPDDSPLPEKFQHLRGKPLDADWKTGAHVGHCEGLQVVAYHGAEKVLLKDGTEEDAPKTEGGLIVQVRPEGVRMREVHCTPMNFNYFINVRRAAEGMMLPLGSILSRPLMTKADS